MLIRPGVWRNIKTTREYLVTGTRIDCTNNKDHLTANEKLMVDYEDDGRKFTRQYDEFIVKFHPVSTI